ncbi:MAG: YidC/Oxa1 family membrane protein insertase [Parcubacteria group bacterium]|nr:YidC/Oxa1 family membrane protein insertase [Parcubacteria group bacterium]
MIADIFNTILYEPLLNGLIFLVGVIPYGDVGFAVIILTLLVKIILFPLSHKSVKTQRKMKEVEPEIKKIKEKYSKDKQEQAKKVMELYKQHSLNPFSGCLFFAIQMPIIIALYWVFWKGLTNGINADLLYSFITVPESVHFNFLGFIDMTGRSYFLAAFAGISQYIQLQLSLPATPVSSLKAGGSFKDEFARNFTFQMRYVFPVFVFIISYTISSAVALYWAVSNIFMIGHELLVRRKARAIASNPDTPNKISE